MIDRTNTTTTAIADFDGASFYSNIYASSVSKTIAISTSVVVILILTPLFYSIIWYEKYGSNQHRTLINQLAASNCWLAIIFNVVVQTSEIVLSIFGPFNSGFCNWQLFLKNMFSVQQEPDP